MSSAPIAPPGSTPPRPAPIHGAPGRINWAVVTMPLELPPNHWKVCLLEEFSQILGLPNDTLEDLPTSFKDRNKIWDLTKYDEIMINALYDPSLKPDMPEADALAVARGIFIRLNGGK